MIIFNCIRYIILLFIILFCVLHVVAQKQNNIWYFGNKAGLDFNSNPPTGIQSPLTTVEGTASICDPAGNLLFYTNGETVWDRNHDIMPNGNSLLGGESSTQAALILPLPNSCTKYCIFVTEDHFTDGGLSYSVVDMCLNDGLGDIISGSKSIILADQTAEKITAIPHSNGSDIWIISHKLNSRDFLAYLLTPSGVSINPVISTVGSFYNSQAHIGPVRASHNGSKIVSSATFYNIVEMFDFDAATGVLSNANDVTQIFGTQQYVYGVEFSPNDSLLYLSTTFVNSTLYQLNLGTFESAVLNTQPGNYHY